MEDGSHTGYPDVSVILQPWVSLTERRSWLAEEMDIADGGSHLEAFEQLRMSKIAHQAGPRAYGAWSHPRRSETKSTSLTSLTGGPMLGDCKKEKKKLKMELPPLPSLGDIRLFTSIPHAGHSGHRSNSEQTLQPLAHTQSHPKPQHSYSWPPSSPRDEVIFSNPFGGKPPLTPPDESDAFKWSTTHSEPAASPRNHSLSSEQDTSRPDLNTQQQSSSASRPTAISLPGYLNLSEQNNSPSTWLERAVSAIVSCHSNDPNNRGQVQMVVQALPSQTKTIAGKPAFQEVAEALQQRANQVPYITITHAVSQVLSMEEVPASPPATPNNQYEHDDYFNNQTIFTHAAVVPNYHGPSQPLISVSTRPTGIIAAPSSIQVSTLERYIPPTTPEEVDDFFSLSRRSYLVDRMTELSATNGTLLLVYPTQVGGAVFARQYIGPVLDPFLRQFGLLNNLTTDAVAALGRLAALPRMTTFEDMAEKLKSLCGHLTQRAPGRGLRGEYKVILAEKAEVTLDRVTWMGWFIEQESARLRQNMIEYQKAGGRMPTRGFDASPGSLAREVVEGIKSSREEAGGVGIEVGVFVVRRSIL